MIRQAQLSGTSETIYPFLFQLAEKLEKCGIHVNHPSSDGFIFTQNVGAPGLVSALWTPYQSNLDYFETTARTNIYIVANDDGFLDEAMARGVLHAMKLGKSIILLQAPLFDTTVSTFARKCISDHTKQYVVANLNALSEPDLSKLTKTVGTKTDYRLTKSELTGIRAELKQHFRGLLKKPAIEAPTLATTAIL